MSDYNLKQILYFLSEIHFTFTNSVDPKEMQQYVAFRVGLHCLHETTHLGVSKYYGVNMFLIGYPLEAKTAPKN